MPQKSNARDATDRRTGPLPQDQDSELEAANDDEDFEEDDEELDDDADVEEMEDDE